MRCSAQALVTLVKAKLRFSRFPKEPELSKRAKSASCRWVNGQAGSQGRPGASPRRAQLGGQHGPVGGDKVGHPGAGGCLHISVGGSCLAGESLRSAESHPESPLGVPRTCPSHRVCVCVCV